MSRPPTLVEALRSRSRLPRDDQLVNFPIIYVENGVEILRESFSDIYEGAREYLAALQRIGIKQGDYVLLQTPSRAKHFRAFWGCALGGIVPVTVAVPVNFDRNSALVGKICGVLNTLVEVRSCLILTEDSVFEDLSSCISLATKRKIEIYSVDSFAKNPDANMCVEATVKPSDVLFLQLTSGSTGVPKCIQETHAGVIHQILGSAEVCGYAGGKTSLNWLPFDHVVPMLACHLRDIYLGMGQVQVPTQEVLANPLLWIDCLEKYKVNFSWSPNFGYNIVTEAYSKLSAEKTWDLSSLEFLLNAGEQVTRSVCDEFIRCVGIQSNVMQPSFGMAESCTCITYCTNYYSSSSIIRVTKDSLNTVLVEAKNNEPGIEFVDLGPVIDGVSIRIAGSDLVSSLPENVVGHFQIKGPVVTRGYVNRPEANQEAFVEDGWFDSGDLGFLRNGRLFLTGRHKENINIRGANLYCYEIEQQVERIPGVLPTYVAATSVFNDSKGTEDLLVFFSPDDVAVDTSYLLTGRGSCEELLELVSAVQKTVTQTTGFAPKHCIPVISSDFHKTTSGKIQRLKFKSLFEDGHYSTHIFRTAKTPFLVQSACYEHTWETVEISPPSHTSRKPGIYVVDPDVESAFLENVVGALKTTGHVFLDADPDVVICFVDLLLTPSDIVDAADYAVEVLRRIGTSLKKTTSMTNSRFFVVISALQVHEHVSESVLSYVRTLALEFPKRKPTAIMCMSTEAAVWNIPNLIGNTALDAAREIMLQGEHTYLASIAPKALPSVTGTLGLDTEALYLVTGGTGALGLELARFLVNAGARHIILSSRRMETPTMTHHLKPLRDIGVQVAVVPGDVRNTHDVENLLRFIHDKPLPLKGVFHLAGVYESCETCNCSMEVYERVFLAKARGAAILHRSLSENSIHLDHFVLFSSVAATIGPIGFAAYAAAYASGNAFLDGFAKMLRRQGMTALSIQWGPWDQAQGMAGKEDFQLFEKINVDEGLRCLGFLMHIDAPPGLILNKFDFAAYKFNAKEDKEFVIPYLLDTQVRLSTDVPRATMESKEAMKNPEPVLKGIVQAIIGVEPKPCDDLFLFGLDSGSVMRLVADIQKSFGVPIPLTFVFKHPTIKLMESYLRERSCAETCMPESNSAGSLESMFATMHPRFIYFQGVHPDERVPVLPNSVSVSEFSSLMSFIDMRRVLGAREFMKRVQDRSLRPPHLCFVLSVEHVWHFESTLSILEAHKIDALWIVSESKEKEFKVELEQVSKAGHVVRRCADSNDLLHSGIESGLSPTNFAVFSFTRENIRATFDDGNVLVASIEDVTRTGVTTCSLVKIPILRLDTLTQCINRGDELFEFPYGGHPLSTNAGMEWFHPEKHSVFKNALSDFFGSKHPLSLDRDLFDWQFKGGSHVVVSASPPAVLGYIPCSFDHPEIGLHAGAQMSMFYVADDGAQTRAERAIEALQAPSRFVNQGEVWSVLVVMAHRETAFPLVKSFGFTGIDPMRRNIRYIDPALLNMAPISPYERVDTQALAKFWTCLQRANPVTAVHRDAEFWAWRYLYAPKGKDGDYRYHFFKMPGTSLEQSGLLVARVQHHALRIVELLPPSWLTVDCSPFMSLVDGVLAWACTQGCQVADFWCTHPDLGNTLERHGWCNQFHPSAPENIVLTPQIFCADGTGRDAPPINIALITSKVSVEGFMTLTSDPKSWYFVKSDGDMDRPPSSVL